MTKGKWKEKCQDALEKVPRMMPAQSFEPIGCSRGTKDRQSLIGITADGAQPQRLQRLMYYLYS